MGMSISPSRISPTMGSSKKKPDELLEGARVEIGEKARPRTLSCGRLTILRSAGIRLGGTGARDGILNARRCQHAHWVTLLIFMVAAGFNVPTTKMRSFSRSGSGATFAKLWMHNGPSD